MCACVHVFHLLYFATIRYILMGGTLPICPLGFSLVISVQYSIRRLLTIFYYICRCVSFGVASVDARIGWLTVGGHVHVAVVLCVMCGLGMHVFYFWLCIFAGWEYACLYIMTGWSPVMDDSIDACLHICVFSVLLLYYYYDCVQVYNFGAVTNNHLQDIISLKVLEHDVEHKQVRETYLVVAVCV